MKLTRKPPSRLISPVIAGLDPAIHRDAAGAFAKGSMDPRVKPAGDSWKEAGAAATLAFA
jgi:hypothetical protein